ncbi:MAG: glutathione S-transferase family protein [Polyangiaceae bacterium]|nr:glutathione S-transferase family protein [Myxococcales bacterium]MCB9590644.1 glutathione S-transferase family protein [Polyangiaceae bacterium]
MYKLHFHPFSQHSRRVVALLNAAGIEHELAMVDLIKGDNMQPSYLALNPNHKVPTLEDGDFRLYESNAILRYLCDKHDLSDWYPKDLKQRALVDQWLDWNQTRLAGPVFDVVFNKMFAGDKADKAAIERGEKTLVELAKILDDALAGKSFLVGDKPTIADLSVASNATQLQIGQSLPAGANIGAWLGRVMEIEGFRKAMPQM